jgi:hypothetical protein
MGSVKLLYKPDWDAAKKRIEAFWKGESIGRPFVLVTARTGEKKQIEYKGSFREKLLDIDHRVRDEEETIKTVYYGGEAVPCVWPDFGPDFTSACIGGGLELADRPADAHTMGAVWAKHTLGDWEKDLPGIKFDPDCIWLKRGIDYTRLAINRGKGKYLVESLDIDGGMDTAAGLRGAERLCTDILDCPENVGELLDKIREGNRQITETLYSLVKDSQGGMINTYKIYAPGKSYNMRSDFSYLISPGLFREIVLPYMIKESEISDYIIFHTHTEDIDRNPENRLKYLDVILDVPKVHAVEWSCPGNSPGARFDGVKRILERGKMAVMWASPGQIIELTRRLGKTERDRVLYITETQSAEEADGLLINLERLNN